MHLGQTWLTRESFWQTNPEVATSVNKNAGLKVTWTGGNPGSYVNVNGGSALVTNGTTLSVSYTCLEHVEAGQFTVPSYILGALPDLRRSREFTSALLAKLTQAA